MKIDKYNKELQQINPLIQLKNEKKTELQKKKYY